MWWCVGKPDVAEDEELFGSPKYATAASSSGMSGILLEEADSEALTNFNPDVPLCKFSCGQPVQPGLYKGRKPFDTCCRSCALNKGIGVHDGTCGGKTPTRPARKACLSGARCRQRTAAHLEAEAHPLDEDYALSCASTRGVEAQPLSLKVLFDWTDADGSGKLSREELEGALEQIRSTCGFLPAINDEAWQHLDEDGNGVVNFGEFAAWAGPRLGLPLGISKMLGRSASMAARCSPCSVLGCPCESFDGPESGADHNRCKCCRHKKGLHVAPVTTGEVPSPDYWKNHDGEFKQQIEMGLGSVNEFQQLVDMTYKTAFTRDRKVHNPTNPKVPTGFTVLKVHRSENSHSWREYACRRAEVETRLQEGKAVKVFEDVKTVTALKDIGGAKAARLSNDCNEWYLFHGTNPAAAKAICDSDFKVSRAGSSTGTLYGKGLYFAESITKADEYAKANEEGNYAVLLCRILGGNVRYTDDPTPDPEDLVHSCIEGDYDSVLGDREKTRGTYREFVLFDSEDVYVEYIIEYKRRYS